MRRALIRVVLICLGLAAVASASTNAQNLAAIQNGLAHLAYQQCPGTPTSTTSVNGSWSTTGSPSTTGNCSGSYNGAFTGMAILAFMAAKSDWPSASVTAYNTDVANAIAYLLWTASTATVSTNDNGVNICPGGTGTCTAIYWTSCSNTYTVYCTGFIAQALDVYALAQGPGGVAINAGPLAGMTWLQIAQGINNSFGAAQEFTAPYTGGWHYTIPSPYGTADMSTTQWGAIASGYGESVGAVTAASVKPGLAKWLAFDLTTGNAACYEGSAGCDIGPTNSENGAWLVTDAYAGTPVSINGPINYLNTNWTSTLSDWAGNFQNTYAMWASYKGLEATIGLQDNTHITSLLTTCGSPGSAPASGICNWFEDYREYLAHGAGAPSATDGGGNLYWPGNSGGGGTSGWTDPMSTSIFVAMLVPVGLPATITNNTTTAPALSQWGLVVLCILLVTFACMKLRGRRTA